MKMNKFLLSFAVLLFLSSCEKENQTTKDECRDFKEALIYFQSDNVKSFIDPLTTDLQPNISENDQFGHQENIELLIERLNQHCNNIAASMSCYSCIYTSPPQSEIVISTDSSGILVTRAIDLLTSKDEALQYMNIHEY
jgi:hypothetical protein